jgi:hypothetical protein
MLKQLRSFFSELLWRCIDGGGRWSIDVARCADNFHHTEFDFFRSAESREVFVYPESNFLLISENDQQFHRDYFQQQGFTLKLEKPEEPKRGLTQLQVTTG